MQKAKTFKINRESIQKFNDYIKDLLKNKLVLDSYSLEVFYFYEIQISLVKCVKLGIISIDQNQNCSFSQEYKYLGTKRINVFFLQVKDYILESFDSDSSETRKKTAEIFKKIFDAYYEH